ncbi:uncharacterized protein [Argopecten irradians]|uniref:uncharacterized protein isoform X2 n=1 Tax=Argopecten irradians TaxID=31199 RepID=UPI0037123DF9
MEKHQRKTDQLINALLFENIPMLLRACHILEKNGIRFKTSTSSSLARSASSVEPGSCHRCRRSRAFTKQKGTKAKDETATTSSRAVKRRRRWTGPVLYNRSEVPNSVETVADAAFLCKVMQHTPTTSLDEISFHLTKNFHLHTPTTSLDVIDLTAMDSCSVASDVIDLPVSMQGVAKRVKSPPSNSRTIGKNTQILNDATTASSLKENTKTESAMFRREQKLERRKLRKMENEDLGGQRHLQLRDDTKYHRLTRPGTPIPFSTTQNSQMEAKKVGTYSLQTSFFRESRESEHFTRRQPNKRWTTYPIGPEMGKHGNSRERRKSTSDVTRESFISIHKQIEEKYGKDELDFSEFTDTSLKQLGCPPIKETDENSNERDDQQIRHQWKLRETHKRNLKPDMALCAKSVISVLKGCVSGQSI